MRRLSTKAVVQAVLTTERALPKPPSTTLQDAIKRYLPGDGIEIGGVRDARDRLELPRYGTIRVSSKLVEEPQHELYRIGVEVAGHHGGELSADLCKRIAYNLFLTSPVLWKRTVDLKQSPQQLVHTYLGLVSEAGGDLTQWFKTVKSTSLKPGGRDKISNQREKDGLRKSITHTPNDRITKLATRVVQAQAIARDDPHVNVEATVKGIMPLMGKSTTLADILDRVGLQLKPMKVDHLKMLMHEKSMALPEMHPASVEGILLPPLPPNTFLNRLTMVADGPFPVRAHVGRITESSRLLYHTILEDYAPPKEVRQILESRGFKQFVLDHSGVFDQNAPVLKSLVALQDDSGFVDRYFHQYLACLTVRQQCDYVEKLVKALVAVSESHPEALSLLARELSTRQFGLDRAALDLIPKTVNSGACQNVVEGELYVRYMIAEFLRHERLGGFLLGSKHLEQAVLKKHGTDFYSKVGQHIVSGADPESMVLDVLLDLKARPPSNHEVVVPTIPFQALSTDKGRSGLPITIVDDISKLLLLPYTNSRYLLDVMGLITSQNRNSLPDEITIRTEIAKRYFHFLVAKYATLSGIDDIDRLRESMTDGHYVRQVVEESAIKITGTGAQEYQEVASKLTRTLYMRHRYFRQMFYQYLAIVYHIHPNLVDDWVRIQIRAA